MNRTGRFDFGCAWREDGIRDVMRDCAHAITKQAQNHFRKPLSELSLHTSVENVALRDVAEILGASPERSSSSVSRTSKRPTRT